MSEEDSKEQKTVFLPSVFDCINLAMKNFREANPNATEEEELKYFISVCLGVK